MEAHHHKLWASSRAIHAHFLKFITLRKHIFHGDKVDARGSISKATDVITWTIALGKLRTAGDKDAAAIADPEMLEALEALGYL